MIRAAATSLERHGPRAGRRADLRGLAASAVARALRLASCVALCATAGPVLAQDPPTEYRLKAAFLYNFAAFTEWPVEVGPTLRLCIHGADPFGAEADALAGKAVGGRSLGVQRRVGLDALPSCHMVFVAASAMAQLPRIVDAVRGLPVLLVADSPGAAHQGVALNMTLVQGRVAFEANVEAARNARLVLSAKMLRLASEVLR